MAKSKVISIFADMEKREELTTEMHSEFLGKEIPKLDIAVMGVYGAIARGVSVDDALQRYGLTLEQYEQNVDRVLST